MGLRYGLRQHEVVEASRFGDLEGLEDLPLASRRRAPLGDAAVVGLERDEVHALQFVAHIAPRVAGRVLDGPDEQEGKPAELVGRADAILAVVERPGGA